MDGACETLGRLVGLADGALVIVGFIVGAADGFADLLGSSDGGLLGSSETDGATDALAANGHSSNLSAAKHALKSDTGSVISLFVAVTSPTTLMYPFGIFMLSHVSISWFLIKQVSCTEPIPILFALGKLLKNLVAS